MDNINNEEYIYLVIPAKYTKIYKALTIKLSQLGTDMLKECSSSCKNISKSVINCWNMFQTACAAYALDEIKKADLIVNYIIAELKLNEASIDLRYDFKLSDYKIEFGAREDTAKVEIIFSGGNVSTAIEYVPSSFANYCTAIIDEETGFITIESEGNELDEDIHGTIKITNGPSSSDTKVTKEIDVTILTDLQTIIE